MRGQLAAHAEEDWRSLRQTCGNVYIYIYIHNIYIYIYTYVYIYIYIHTIYNIIHMYITYTCTHAHASLTGTMYGIEGVQIRGEYNGSLRQKVYVR